MVIGIGDYVYDKNDEIVHELTFGELIAVPSYTRRN